MGHCISRPSRWPARRASLPFTPLLSPTPAPPLFRPCLPAQFPPSLTVPPSQADRLQGPHRVLLQHPHHHDLQPGRHHPAGAGQQPQAKAAVMEAVRRHFRPESSTGSTRWCSSSRCRRRSCARWRACRPPSSTPGCATEAITMQLTGGRNKNDDLETRLISNGTTNSRRPAPGLGAGCRRGMCLLRREQLPGSLLPSRAPSSAPLLPSPPCPASPSPLPADAALDYAVAQSYDHMYGARPLRRWLEHSIITPLSA